MDSYVVQAWIKTRMTPKQNHRSVFALESIITKQRGPGRQLQALAIAVRRLPLIRDLLLDPLRKPENVPFFFSNLMFRDNVEPHAGFDLLQILIIDDQVSLTTR
jgi:hypothetical protein